MDSYPKEDFTKDLSAALRWQITRPYEPKDEAWQIEFVRVMQVKYAPGDLLGYRGPLIEKWLQILLTFRQPIEDAGLLSISADKKQVTIQTGLFAALYEILVERQDVKTVVSESLVRRAQHLQGEFWPDSAQ